MRDENCIFCKIANGEIPSATIYEDDDFRVILDLGPATKGHALILPKEHAADIYSIDEELAGKAFKLAKKITTRLKDVLGVTDIISYRITGKWPVRPYSISICI